MYPVLNLHGSENLNQPINEGFIASNKLSCFQFLFL